MNKRFTKISVIVLAFILCVGGSGAKYVYAKSIYYPGIYQKNYNKGRKLVLEINKYSSPEDKMVGNYRIYCKKSNKQSLWEYGEFKKGKKNNTYMVGDMKIIVYKKKVVIKNGGTVSGTYKLKRRAHRS